MGALFLSQMENAIGMEGGCVRTREARQAAERADRIQAHPGKALPGIKTTGQSWRDILRFCL